LRIRIDTFNLELFIKFLDYELRKGAFRMPRIMDTYIEKTLDLVPLDLPPEDLISERDIDAIEAITEAITIEVNLPSSRFGPGRVAVAIHPGYKKALYMGVSPSMTQRGLKRSAVLDAGLKMYSKCWNKPTIPQTCACVVMVFINWLLARV
jgi:hypothetical protein